MSSATTTTTPPTVINGTTSTHPSDPTPHLTALKQDGFIIIRSLLPQPLLLSLQATSKYLTTKARSGEWPYVRTVPKQYPPWQPFQPGDNIWGIQHLLHPDNTVRDIFAEVYFSPVVLNIAKELVGLNPSDPKTDSSLVMELFNLLVSPSDNQDFELAWHRDDIRPDISSAEEAEQLAKKSPNGAQLHAQYNIALFADDSLVVVPGSHARVRTEIERSADLYAPSLPGQVTVHLDPGDGVFYNSNILHRGVYRGIDAETALGRMTLHGSVGLAGHGSERARQVLQHAVGEWVGRAEFGALEGETKERAEGMRMRLMEMGSGGKDWGYSLQG